MVMSRMFDNADDLILNYKPFKWDFQIEIALHVMLTVAGFYLLYENKAKIKREKKRIHWSIRVSANISKNEFQP